MSTSRHCDSSFFFNDTATTEIYTLSLHDALPISCAATTPEPPGRISGPGPRCRRRSEEHTSELQSRRDLVCRLLLEKNNVPFCPRFAFSCTDELLRTVSRSTRN